MDNHKKLAENLLKADGIDPASITESERAVFKEMLDSEKKRMNRLSWFSVGVMWLFVIALIALSNSEDLLEKLHIPFAIPVIVLATTMVIVMMRWEPGHINKLRESDKKVSKLHYLVYGGHRGFAMVSRKNGKRVIHWPSILILTVALWLMMSLGGAGVYYLMCQRWIYASPSGAMWVHIFLTLFMPLGFLIGILRQGLKAPLEELAEEKPKPSKPDFRPDIWRIIMHSKITKFATAAIIVAALTILYQLTGSIDGASTAYARMIENVRKAHSVRYNVTYVHNDGTSYTNTVLINSAGVKRIEIMGDTALLFYPNRDFSMTLWTKQKRAFITRQKNMKYPQINMLEFTLNTKNRAGEYKGRQVIEGRPADLYISEWRLGKNSIWVDPKTELPVYVEEQEYKDPNRVYPQLNLAVSDFGGDGGRCGGAGGEPFTTIKSDFQWNIEFDESLFSEVPPADYTITESTVNCSDPNESHVVEALQFWAEYHDGQFPASIEMLADANEIRPMLIKKFNQDGDPEKEYEAAFEYGGFVLKGIRFAQDRRAKSNWFYNKGVMLGETDRPVCWWRLEDSESYRVIFGDLSIEDLLEEPQ